GDPDDGVDVGAQIREDRRRRYGDDRGVDQDHEEAHAQRPQRRPRAAISGVVDHITEATSGVRQESDRTSVAVATPASRRGCEHRAARAERALAMASAAVPPATAT